jgi:hypothetical protein
MEGNQELGPPEVNDAWVDSILANLLPENGERLLDFDRDELRFLDHTLRTEARSIVYELPIPENERKDVLASDRSTALLAFENPGKYAHAAAWYAVMHDRLRPEASDGLRNSLRLQLGLSLFRLGDEPPMVKRCVGVLLPLAEKFLAGQESPFPEDMDSTEFRLAFLQIVVVRLTDLGERRRAVEFHRLIAELSPGAKEKLRAFNSMAICLNSVGEKQAAFRFLMEGKPLLPEVDDPLDIETWRLLAANLQRELGRPDPHWEPGPKNFLESREVWLTQDALRRSENSSAFQLGEIRREMEARSERHRLDEPLFSHRFLLASLTFVSMSPRTLPEIWETKLEEAEKLEARFSEETPKLERKLLSAVLLMARERHLDAAEEFQRLWPDVLRLLTPEAQAEAASWYLEAMGASAPQRFGEQILALVDHLESAVASDVARWPIAAARAKARDDHRRSIEAALGALLTAAASAPLKLFAAPDQVYLARAWRLIETSRNPELSAAVLQVPDDKIQEHLRLENRFHRALRAAVIGPSGELDVDEAATDLADFETIWFRSVSPTERGALDSADDEGVSVAWFEIRDLLRPVKTVVMSRDPIRYRARLIDQSMLADWQEQVQRDRLSVRPSSGEELATGIARDLFCDQDPGPAPELIIDGSLYSVPVEALPDPWFPETRFGVNRAWQIRLNRTPRRSASPPESLRGWLGIGDAPEAPRFPYLASTRQEILNIEGICQTRGFVTQHLLDGDATPTRLRNLLKENPPSILHIAAHGSADQREPERCALVLAPDAENPAGELLTFRQIVALDLSQVELVILSTCSSLAGQLDRSGGMHGLAWAFLKAGAGAVLGSRHPVGDHATLKLMTSLYEHLFEHRPAVALRNARAACLSQGMSLREACAWALWV